VVLTTHLLLVPSCERVGAIPPPPLCADTGISLSGLDSKMVYKFSQSVSYYRFTQCVSHWLGDWKIEFEFPAWAQLFFCFPFRQEKTPTGYQESLVGKKNGRGVKLTTQIV